VAVGLRILLVAGAGRDEAWLKDTLAVGNYAASCLRVDDEQRCGAALDDGPWDAVVCMFDGARAPRALRALRDRGVSGAPTMLIVCDAFEDAAEAAQRLGAPVCLRGAGFSHLGPAVEHAVRRGRIRADAAAFEQAQRLVLEHIASGRPLAEVLEEIVLMVERQGEGMLCSILILDAEARRVRHGAAPHLPRALIQGIDGAQIGPREGSCGAAAFLRDVVIVDDIGTHPNWANYRQLALPFGLCACWSSPIFAPSGAVLGTFAMYYREPKHPEPSEQAWVARATYLAAIAIGRDRAEQAARQANARYRQIVDTTSEGVWLLDADARTMFVNQQTAKMLGYAPDELAGRRIVEFMDEPSRRSAEGTFIRRLRTTSEQYEFRFRRRDGTCFWALISGSPIHDDKHEVVGALGMIADISELKRTEQALRESEAELRVVFENAAIGMALVNDEGRLVKTNVALQQFLGYDEAALAALTFTDLSHPDDVEQDIELFRSFKGGARRWYQRERRYIRKDGAVAWGRLTASLVRPQKGVAHSVIAIVENVTERREMEEAVRTSERLRALMYSAVYDVLFYIGVEGGNRFRFLSVNPAFTRSTGLKEADVVGRALEEVIPEPSRSVVVKNYLRAIQERRTVTWDEVTSYPSGMKYGEVSITPVFDGAGTCTNLVGTVHDVTERRVAERRLFEQAALLDKAKDAILVRDLDGVIQYWNKGAERLYGWTGAEAVGRNIRELLWRDDTNFGPAQQRLIEAGQWSGELIQQTKLGARVVIEGSWTLIRDGEGHPRSVLVINTDITARKNLEGQVFHAQRMESLGALAGGIAHDFNNLLTVIEACFEIAQGEVDGGRPAREALVEGRRAASRGAELVRQLMTFSRREESKRRVIALEPAVAEALGLLRLTLPRGVRVETHFHADVPEVLADPTQINQIVMNLGKNAAHAMNGSPGVLEARLERAALEEELATQTGVLRPGLYARFAVSDDGTGMDAATVERIFDPFFTTKAAGVGTGLGLFVVQGIMRNHEGGIVVRSAPGRGTTLDLYFPAFSPPR
jgi:PAS domain S-box-containing protein